MIWFDITFFIVVLPFVTFLPIYRMLTMRWLNIKSIKKYCSSSINSHMPYGRAANKLNARLHSITHRKRETRSTSEKHERYSCHNWCRFEHWSLSSSDELRLSITITHCTYSAGQLGIICCLYCCYWYCGSCFIANEIEN